MKSAVRHEVGSQTSNLSDPSAAPHLLAGEGRGLEYFPDLSTEPNLEEGDHQEVKVQAPSGSTGPMKGDSLLIIIRHTCPGGWYEGS